MTAQKGQKMKENSLKITVRMTAEDKKNLDQLALKDGHSINKTVLNLVNKTIEKNEITGELLNVKEQVNLLSETVAKQTKVIGDLVSALRVKGAI